VSGSRRRRAPFDAVSSIEMGEHVGAEQYPTYTSIMFQRTEARRRPLLQQMSRRINSAPGGGAFIESYIAPDMTCARCGTRWSWYRTRGFEVRNIEAMREHYVTTVHDWISLRSRRTTSNSSRWSAKRPLGMGLYLVGGAPASKRTYGVDQLLAVNGYVP